MPAVQAAVSAHVVDAADDAVWDEFGVHPQDVAEWKARDFGAFEAAIAQGDGFTPSWVAHYRHQLVLIARSWAREGLDCCEGLKWHRAGFAAKEASTYHSGGIGVEAARALRDGYGTDRAPRAGRAPDRSGPVQRD